MNSRKSQTFVGRPAEPGVYSILIRDGFLYLADIYFAFIVPKTQRVNINSA